MRNIIIYGPINYQNIMHQHVSYAPVDSEVLINRQWKINSIMELF